MQTWSAYCWRHDSLVTYCLVSVRGHPRMHTLELLTHEEAPTHNDAATCKEKNNDGQRGRLDTHSAMLCLDHLLQTTDDVPCMTLYCGEGSCLDRFIPSLNHQSYQCIAISSCATEIQ